MRGINMNEDFYLDMSYEDRYISDSDYWDEVQCEEMFDDYEDMEDDV